MQKWLGHTFSTGTSTGQDYLQFQKEAKRDLKKQASMAGYELYSFSKNHYCFSAVLQHKKTGEFVYISIPDVHAFPDAWFIKVLYRSMAHAEDWTGGLNNYCAWNDIKNIKI